MVNVINLVTIIILPVIINNFWLLFITAGLFTFAVTYRYIHIILKNLLTYRHRYVRTHAQMFVHIYRSS
jgi:hypothetical protein